MHVNVALMSLASGSVSLEEEFMLHDLRICVLQEQKSQESAARAEATKCPVLETTMNGEGCPVLRRPLRSHCVPWWLRLRIGFFNRTNMAIFTTRSGSNACKTPRRETQYSCCLQFRAHGCMDGQPIAEAPSKPSALHP